MRHNRNARKPGEWLIHFCENNRPRKLRSTFFVQRVFTVAQPGSRPVRRRHYFIPVKLKWGINSNAKADYRIQRSSCVTRLFVN
jgi:hypothetical protein